MTAEEEAPPSKEVPQFLDNSYPRQNTVGNCEQVKEVPSKLLPKSALDSPVSSPRGIVNSRLQGSPIRSAVRPASPSKLATPSLWSPSRGVSPSRARIGVAGSLSSRFGNEPSVLSFVVDVPRIVDAHLLRLMHNRLMQWRFVNARADAALSVQTLNAELWVGPGSKAAEEKQFFDSHLAPFYRIEQEVFKRDMAIMHGEMSNSSQL